MKKHKYLWACIYGAVLFAFTVYALLDTFVIVRVYEVPEQPVKTVITQETDGTEVDLPDTETEQLTSDTADTVYIEPVFTENSYVDSNMKIEITEYRYNNTNVYVADIVLSSPEYLKTALAKSTYGKNVTDKTSVIADGVGAILAINGDYYGARESGYVIRNGILYRDRASKNGVDLVVYEDGGMQIINESDITAQELIINGAYNVLSFGPGLISDGQITVSENYEVGVAMASNPRTAVGMIDDLHYVFVVSDGRTTDNEGLSLYELAEFMKNELNAVTAYNLDGGGSSTMVFNGTVINNPTTNGRKIKERSVSDIVYIGY